MGRLKGATIYRGEDANGNEILHVIVDDSEYPFLLVGILGKNTPPVRRHLSEVNDFYQNGEWELAEGQGHRMKVLGRDAPLVGIKITGEHEKRQSEHLRQIVENKIFELAANTQRIARSTDAVFIESLASRMNAGYYPLSAAQIHWVDDIWERVA